MMKTIGRIFAILVVIGIITAGIYAIVQRNPAASGLVGSQTGLNENPGNDFENFTGGNAELQSLSRATERQIGFREPHHDFSGDDSFGHGLLGILRTLLVFALITLIVIVLQKTFASLKSRLGARTG